VRRFVVSLLYALAGYVLGALVGYVLIEWFSTNTHDRSVEAAMTSAFVFGPLGAVIAFVAGFVIYGRRSRSGSAEG
jgi:prolipoprotein diacylglyceryltransferase